MTRNERELPEFLQTADEFFEHLDKQFDGDDNTSKGSSFLDFACRLLPLCEFWSTFDTPKPSAKKTHDKGVDFHADSEDGLNRFCGQSKYKIKDTSEFDQIFSKFKNYEDTFLQRPGQQPLLPGLTTSTPSVKPGKRGKRSEDGAGEGFTVQRLRFIVVTSSNLSRIRSMYADSRMGSRDYYQKLVDEKRIEVVDASELLPLLQSLWRKSFVIAPEIELDLQYLPIKHEDTYLSVISARTLRELYKKHGSSLFFENIRDFLGVAIRSESDLNSDVNGDIVRTLTMNPERMLGRNNGITLKADHVVAETDTRLRLSNCSIVNGCQTTMCIAHAGPKGDSAMVVVKIVLGQDSWDVARAANYQNRVTRIELELAQFLRPQLVRKAATELSYAIPNAADENTVSNVLDAVYKQKLSYDSLRYLYIGLFSRVVSNLITADYAALRLEILQKFYAEDKNERLMRILFLLLKRAEGATTHVKERHANERYAPVFRRFFDENKAQYRCVLAILTACGCVDITLEKPQDDAEAYKMMSAFIDKIEVILESHIEYFNKVFSWAFVTLAGQIMDAAPSGDSNKVSQAMHSEVVTAAGAAFPSLVIKLRMLMGNDDSLRDKTPDLSHISS